MKKKISLSSAVCLMIISACAALLVTMLVLILTDSVVIGSAPSWYSKVKEIDRLVSRNYYYEIADEEELADFIASGYMYGLGDPYAAYYNDDETEVSNMSNRGAKIGIGATVIKSDDMMYVYQVDRDGPADKSGILPGDYIIGVDGSYVSVVGFDEISEAIQGEVGTSCVITLLRGEEEMDVTVVREEFEITTVYYRMINKTGYLNITRFNDKTAEQMIAAIEEMRRNGAENLIFDLRYCGGGLVDPTAQALDYLLPKGNIISATYADGRHKVLHTSDEQELDMPMAVLTSGSTASAAELFAAAIRDYEKGVLVGTTTYGKGVMQHTYTLSDGTSVKFTTGEFQPPCGVGFDGVGVEPDIVVELSEEQQENYYMLNEENDPQLIAALEQLNK